MRVLFGASSSRSHSARLTKLSSPEAATGSRAGGGTATAARARRLGKRGLERGEELLVERQRARGALELRRERRRLLRSCAVRPCVARRPRSRAGAATVLHRARARRRARAARMSRAPPRAKARARGRTPRATCRAGRSGRGSPPAPRYASTSCDLSFARTAYSTRFWW